MVLSIDTTKPFHDKPVPAAREDEYEEVAWAIEHEGSNATFKKIKINRGVVGPKDVKFQIKYCGICHSDLHTALNHLGGCTFPIVPGHELVGVVTETGKDVTKVKVGDKVGVGCFVDACLECGSCKTGDEQYCQNGVTFTYNSIPSHGRVPGNPETQTFGGYSGSVTVQEHFAMKIPDTIPLEKAGPLMCAAITMYDPLRHWGATKGNHMNIGIVGIGGLGTMGIKIAKALGHTVYAISTNPNKKNLATQKGADHFVVSTDPESITANTNKIDLILNSVSAPHKVETYVPLLNSQGTIVQLGLVTEPHTVNQLPLIFQRKAIAGSCIGGIQSTEECIALCAKHGIVPDIELVTADQIEEVYCKLEKVNETGLRYIIDIQKSITESKL